jgi:hypothetical protein
MTMTCFSLLQNILNVTLTKYLTHKHVSTLFLVITVKFLNMVSYPLIFFYVENTDFFVYTPIVKICKFFPLIFY